MTSLRSPLQLVKRFLQKRKWAESAALSDGERHVLSRFLESEDPRLRKFWLQWTSSERFERTFPQPGQQRYELQWSRANTCLSHNSLREHHQTEPLVITDELSRRQLQFRLSIRPGGWAGPLTGETLDGSPFPLEWKPELPETLTDGSELAKLPPRADQCAGQARLEAWLPDVKIDPGFIDFVEFFNPATDAELEQLEQRLNLTLPAACRAFLQCTNGLLIGENYFPGTKDACPPPFPDDSYPPALFLTDDVINHLGDGFFCLPLEGEDAQCVVHYDMYGEKEVISQSLPEFLKLKLETLPTEFLDYCDLLRVEI